MQTTLKILENSRENLGLKEDIKRTKEDKNLFLDKKLYCPKDDEDNKINICLKLKHCQQPLLYTANKIKNTGNYRKNCTNSRYREEENVKKTDNDSASNEVRRRSNSNEQTTKQLRRFKYSFAIYERNILAVCSKFLSMQCHYKQKQYRRMKIVPLITGEFSIRTMRKRKLSNIHTPAKRWTTKAVAGYNRDIKTAVRPLRIPSVSTIEKLKTNQIKIQNFFEKWPTNTVTSNIIGTTKTIANESTKNNNYNNCKQGRQSNPPHLIPPHLHRFYKTWSTKKDVTNDKNNNNKEKSSSWDRRHSTNPANYQLVDIQKTCNSISNGSTDSCKNSSFLSEHCNGFFGASCHVLRNDIEVENHNNNNYSNNNMTNTNANNNNNNNMKEMNHHQEIHENNNDNFVKNDNTCLDCSRHDADNDDDDYATSNYNHINYACEDRKQPQNQQQQQNEHKFEDSEKQKIKADPERQPAVKEQERLRFYQHPTCNDEEPKIELIKRPKIESKLENSSRSSNSSNRSQQKHSHSHGVNCKTTPSTQSLLLFWQNRCSALTSFASSSFNFFTSSHYQHRLFTISYLLTITLMLLIYSCPCTLAIRLQNGLTKSSPANREQLNIGLVAPHTNFGKREYLRAINTAVQGLTRTRGAKLTFLKDYTFEPKNIHFDMMSLTPSPTAILSTLCKEFLRANVSAILYMMNNEQFGHSTASAQYFLQLAGYLGVPVISWNADNSGLERRASQSTLQLQLAPSIEHQSAAMLSILERYKWHQFSVVTSQIAGHDDFVQAVRERVAEMQEHFKFTILNSIVVTRTSDLMELVNSEARVMLLYATQSEAITILRAAEEMKLTGENYVWVVSQSVIEKKDAHPQFPVGMLGVHFDTSSPALMNEISNAIKIYGYGVEAFLTDPTNRGRKLTTQSLSCEDEDRGRWDTGEVFFRYLRNVSIEGDLNKPNIEFTADGDLKSAELKIMNLRPSVNSKNLVWEEIGVWKSWESQKLDIRDIAWPGNSHAPPQGVPEKFHLKITFLEEAPYINLSPADPVSGKCLMDRGVLCRVAADHEMAADIDVGQAHRNESFYQCCSGFCIDLLEKFAEELGFTYELVRVEDGKWGTLENGKWNGLIADLVNRKTDMVLTSLMINTEREAVVDFSEPFMETGIAIVVAKRTGIISPTAFLEPFDTASWMLVGIVAIQAATFMIFLFEWLSPSGYDMKLYLQNSNVTPYRFSLFRTYWLVWAVLFQAAVHVDSPRGFTSRFMTNVWALFAVVFLAIYTANLAAFMITREEFHEFSGLNDSRLVHPYSHKPSFKYGTIPYSHTDSTIHKYYKDMHLYMRQYNKTSVADGVAAVLNGNLDAFIYDGTVLDYLVAQDEDCRLMTVGSWYAMTGYGLAFSRNSKYVQMFNKRLLEFRANGDLERLRRYWMTGTCRPGKQEHKSSDPLALEQFLSAFLLLMAGILLAALLLALEHIYFKYIRKRIAKKDGGHCCALISLSMGKSLTFRGAVFEATEILKKHRCNDPICDTHLWKVKHELDMTRLRVRQLEKSLDKHGIKPPQLRLASSSDLLNHHLKERPPLLGNLSLAASAQDLYRWSYKTEIAEMETVL